MTSGEKSAGIFWMALNVVCALWNFLSYAEGGRMFNFVIGAFNTVVAAMLVNTMMRYWKT